MGVQHQPVKARELRDGDLMRLGASTNYVLVSDARERDGRIHVTVYNGDVPNPGGPTLSYAPDEAVYLTQRGASATITA